MEPKVESEEPLQSSKNDVALPTDNNTHQKENHDNDSEISEPSEEEKIGITPKKEPTDLQNVENGDDISQANEAKQEPVNINPREDSDSQRKDSESDEKYRILTCKKTLKSEESSLSHTSQQDSITKAEKLQSRRHVDHGAQGFQYDAKRVPYKGSDDGYNWRKYGQKSVKGKKFVRSYYRCTYPSCQAKKQVERSHDGKTDVNYLGKHQHDSKSQEFPKVVSGLRVGEHVLLADAERNSDVHQYTEPTNSAQPSTVERMGCKFTGVRIGDNDIREDCSGSKRQKRESTDDDGMLNEMYNQSRRVVQTVSEIDLVYDGYQWRKYGQKLVRGTPYPRSYYRCSNAGCTAKKHVERASHDRNIVVTTYDGEHAHDIPLPRIRS